MNLPLGQQQRVPERGKISGGVIEDGDPARLAPFPDGLAWDEGR
jgi:hypothetical protein